MTANATSAIVASISKRNAFSKIGPIGWRAFQKGLAYNEWRKAVQKGGQWDFKTFLDPSQNGPAQVGNCPHEMCDQFITICGSCYRYDIVANIHYGYVGIAAGFSTAELKNGAGIAQIKDNWNGWMPDQYWDEAEDADAIDVGIDVRRGKSLCAALRGRRIHAPPAGCSPCPLKWAK